MIAKQFDTTRRGPVTPAQDPRLPAQDPRLPAYPGPAPTQPKLMETTRSDVNYGLYYSQVITIRQVSSEL